MSRVLLIDVDLKYRSKRSRGDPFPNLALMKISTYEKSRGNIVGFDIENPDITYISCVFTKNRLNAIMECCNTFNTDRTFGGSGISLDFALMPQMQALKPDYDLYPFQSYSMGFTTRGCIRNCEFCIVHEKEGKFRKVQHIKEFHDFRFKSCKLLDNNILADKDWFFENTDWAIDNKVKLDITQGMDIRLLTPEIAEQLKRIRFVNGQMRFAWDNITLEPKIKAGIEMLKDAGINTYHDVSFFVLSGYNTPFCKDLYRCNKLKEFGAMPYVMPYEGASKMVRALSRWANRRHLVKSIPFYKYDRMPKEMY